MDELTRCAGIKRDGGRCTQSVGAEKTFCHNHDPARAEQRSENASKAVTKRHRGTELAQIKGRLKDVVEGVLSGTIPTGRGSVAFQGFGQIIKCIEQERKQKELEDLQVRVEELELTLETQRQEGGSWYGIS
jgi:hypothetical protein